MRAFDAVIREQLQHTRLPGEWTLRIDCADLVTTRGQSGKHSLSSIGFELERIARIRERFAEQKARPCKSRERIHPIVDETREHGSECLWLTVRALRAERKMRPAISQIDARVQRMERAFPPAHSTSSPAALASVCGLVTMPRVERARCAMAPS